MVHWQTDGMIGKLLSQQLTIRNYDVGYMTGICMELAHEPWEAYADTTVYFIERSNFDALYPYLATIVPEDASGCWYEGGDTIFVFYTDLDIRIIQARHSDEPLRYFRWTIYHEMWHAICSRRGGGYEYHVPEWSNRCEEREAQLFAYHLAEDVD